MNVCPPAIVTAACFVAVILLDLYTHEWGRAPGHALFGVFAVLLMIFICERTNQTVAWILLASPFVLVLFAWIVRAFGEMTKYDNHPGQEEAGDGNRVDYGCPCPCCGSLPCHCMKPCFEPKPCRPKPKPKPKPKPEDECEPKNKPCMEDSYFGIWLKK